MLASTATRLPLKLSTATRFPNQKILTTEASAAAAAAVVAAAAEDKKRNDKTLQKTECNGGSASP